MDSALFDLDVELVPAHTDAQQAELTQEFIDGTTLSPHTQGWETMCACW